MASILIVEDEHIVAMDIQATLTRLGYTVAGTASSGEEALVLAEQTRPDCVLMDIMLRGDLDGVDAAATIRERWAIPVVFLTAYTDDKHIARATATEPFGFIIKPFHDRELKSAIEIALYKSRAERELRARERWYATTLRSIGDGVISADVEQRVTFMNGAAERLTAWPAGDARGRRFGEVFSVVQEDSRAPVDDPVARALRERQAVLLPEHSALLRRDGAELPIDDSAAPIIDDDGQLLGAVVVFRDASEKRRMQARLLVADRMASVGMLAAGIGHEINNPLAYVVANIDYALQELELPASPSRPRGRAARRVPDRRGVHQARQRLPRRREQPPPREAVRHPQPAGGAGRAPRRGVVAASRGDSVFMLQLARCKLGRRVDTSFADRRRRDHTLRSGPPPRGRWRVMFERKIFEFAAPCRGVFLAVASAVILGCGGGSAADMETTPKAPTATTVAPASTKAGAAAAKPARPTRDVKPAALREFDSGLRVLKLGGPEANERAAESFERATAADPSLWEAWHDLGVVRARSGDDRRAVAAFSKALEAKPGHVPSLVARAEASRRMGKRGDAKGDYEAALKSDPDDLATRLRLASLQREANDTDGSIKAVREVLRRNPQGKDLADANVELGLCYLAGGREELAQLVLGKAATLEPKNPKVWNALGLLALKQGKDQEAFQRFDHATNVDPTFRDARFNKAAVLLDAGDYGQARRELDAALKGQPTTEDGADLDALIALGVAERGLGEYPRASATWERVLKVAPQNPDALYNLAVLNMDFTKDEAKARDYLTRYRSAASDEHPRYKEAQSRMDQLGPSPQEKAPPAAPAPKAPAKSGGKPKGKPRRRRRSRFGRWLLVAATLLSGGVAAAAPAKPKAAKTAPAQAKPTEVAVERPAPTATDKPTGKKEKTFDFAAMGIEGRVLAPQLMYLLGRIKVELERGDLQARSFVPELVRSVDEGGL